MRLSTFVVLGLVASLALAACAAPATPLTLDNTSWILVELNGQPVLTDPLATLTFKDGQLGGSDSCNRYGGTYTLEGNKFSVGKDLVSTMMACPDEIMQQASNYTAALLAATQANLQGGQLVLQDEAGKTLAVFDLQKQDLAGTNWLVTGFNNGNEAVVSPILGTELSLRFDAEGKLNGNAGCNSYFGSYETTGAAITISELGRTEMYCLDPENPGDVMDQEDQFLAALASAATFRLEGNSLELRTAGDQIALHLVKAP